MEINWLTLIAQIVNFLILVYLLKRLLYDRIVNAMDKREEKISSRIKESESKNEEAQQKLEEYNRKMEEIEKEKDEILNKAREEADQKKKKLLKEAREEIDELRDKWRQSIDSEKKDFYADLKKSVGEHIYSISRRVLKEMADERIESKIVDLLIEKIEAKGDRELKEIFENDKKQLYVKSSFEMVKSDREKLEKAIKADKKRKIEYEKSSDMICGVEMRTDGDKISWNIDSYLKDLEDEFNRKLRHDSSEPENMDRDREKNNGEEKAKKSEREKAGE